MKTKKLNLNDLKVESFITSLENEKNVTIKGGTSVAVTVPIIVVDVEPIVISIIVSAITVSFFGTFKNCNNCSYQPPCGGK